MAILSPRASRIRSEIEDFILQRRDDKLDKLADDDAKRDDLKAQYRPAAWLLDAARRVSQLQMVTHTLKAIHPDAKGSSLFVPASSLPNRDVVGSHCLPVSSASDVVGNAAALDVYKFLKLEHDGQTLLDLLQAGDADALAALSNDTEQAQTLRDAFVSITEPNGGPGSHARAKQLYWLLSPDPDELPNPLDNCHYHLLSPLYASAFSHHLYQTIQQHRFGDEAKAARQAKRDGVDHPHGYSDYPQLAEEKKGGTKPQNISQLNSERKGSNYLLASLPPVWESSGLAPLYHSDSAFSRFGRRREVLHLLRELRTWLEKHYQAPAEGEEDNSPNNIYIRDRRKKLQAQLFDELLVYSAEIINSLPAGWTAHADCKLPVEEQCWLDPWRAAGDEDFNKTWQWQDWPLQVAERFARWLNSKLDKTLPVNDAEFRYWARELAGDRDWQMLQAEQQRTLTALDRVQDQKGDKDAD